MSHDNKQSGWKDYSSELRLEASRPLRIVLWAVGTLALGSGIAGIFLPVVPTTPFLLLAAACYARSSARFYNWLMNQRFLGPYIRTWRETGAVPERAKVLAIVLITATVGTSVVFFIPIFAVRVLVATIGIAVIIFLARLPSSPTPTTPTLPQTEPDPAVRARVTD